MSSESKQLFARLDDETGAPVVAPLVSLEELAAWFETPKNDAACVARVTLESRLDHDHVDPDSSSLPRRPRTLVCHDFKGGYLEDKLVQGACTERCYRFCHWHYVDVFVYFSHKFVTIPPPCWSNAAHRHGVPVLGTVITEWEAGARICQDFLKDTTAYTSFAHQLVAVAAYYKFDGWLVNIENKVDEELIPNLVAFLQVLTEAMHKSVPNSQVIWYDSVIHSGELKWQDELNKLNSCFFDVCDGIFLNYCWKDKNLEDSADAAHRCKRPHDVYVGVDVFGRGCIGGGGYNTCEAVEAAQAHHLSVAIFAQAWVFQEHGPENFIANENHFWEKLSKYRPDTSDRLQKLPLYTTFCQGWGKHFHVNGTVLDKQPWTNMSLQYLQPTSLAVGEGATVHTDTAFLGGSCIELRLTRKSSNQQEYKLFDTNILLREDTLIKFTWKYNSATEPDVQLLLETVNNSNITTVYRLVHCSQDSDCSMQQEETSRNRCKFNDDVIVAPVDVVRLPSNQHHTSPWLVSSHSISVLQEKQILKHISVHLNRCEQKSDEAAKEVMKDASVLLGRLEILPHSLAGEAPLTVVKNLVHQAVCVEGEDGARVASLSLAWGYTGTKPDLYLVYYSPEADGEWTLVGRAAFEGFRVCKLVLNKGSESLHLKVQPVCRATCCPDAATCTVQLGSNKGDVA